MKYIRIPLVVFSLIGLWFSLSRCEKDRQAVVHLSTITLYDKPLYVIQSYISGKWKLQYTYGGFAVQKHLDTENSYLILSANHIITGNDSSGVVVDTTIAWVRTDIGSNEFTYLLSYSWSGYLWPEHYVIDQMKNDTLIIREYVSDPLTFYYTKY